jgi:bifunctional N-acetylglucosamine-1-phosphate-uridyltransferase/glucosamine-1-phosphate-acetyltransferase GlmU-like protein
MPLISNELLYNFIKDSDSAKLLVSKLENPYGYGRIIYDDNNKFIGIIEEKDCNENEKKINIINAGIYLFNSDILKKYIPLIDNNNVQKEYYLTDIIKIIRNNNLNIDIKTYLIEDQLKYQIQGVNTQDELKNLESLY